MSELTDMARDAADKARQMVDTDRTEEAFGFLFLAVDALCDELDKHQHKEI